MRRHARGGGRAGGRRGVERAHASWLAGLDARLRLAAGARTFRAKAPDTSAWSVGEHLEHLLLADRGIAGVLESAVGRGPRRPEFGAGRPNFRGYLVLWTGFIPRGAGKAPPWTRPGGLSREEVERGLAGERERVAGLAPELAKVAAARDTFPHPALGRFTPARWVRFAAVHHAHHERIIGEILAAAGIDRGS